MPFEPPPPTHKTLPTGPLKPGVPMGERSHDRTRADRYNGWFAVRLTTRDPLHIGSGGSNYWDYGGRDGMVLARDVIVQARAEGEYPVIPGSSMKGAVRTLCEALGGGCALDEDPRVDRPCSVCALFGHLTDVGGFLSRVGFDDAYPEDAAHTSAEVLVAELGPVPFPPRKTDGRRVYGVRLAQGDLKVPYIVVDTGVSFMTRVHLHNVEAWELGMVLLAMGVDGSFWLRLGGGKPTGFGRVSAEVTGALLRKDYRSPRPTRLGADDAQRQAGDAITKALARIEAPDNGRESASTRALRVIREVMRAER